jgi:Vitamin K-dependent gamma-carboxylase
MTTAHLKAGLARASARWGHFWFDPQSTATLAVVRILFGFVVLEWSISLLPDLTTFFSSRGVLPRQPGVNLPGLWAPFSLSSSFGVEIVIYIALVAAAVCLILGVGTRLASAIVWLGVLAFTRRNPYVFNSGDSYLRVVAFYLALTPAGASLSMRRWLSHRSEFWRFPRRSLWGLRLLQVQVSIVYLSACWDKLRAGPLWNDGTAMSYVLRIGDVTRFPTPVFPTNSVAINLMTYGTIAVEFALGVLVWNKRLRPWVLAVGIAFHLIIDYSIRVGSFSFVAIVALIAFVSPEASARAIYAIRSRLLIGSGHLRDEVLMSGIPERAPTVGTERH